MEGSKTKSSPSSPSGHKRGIDSSPSNVLDFAGMCVMFVLRRFIFPPVHIKIGIYMIALIICSCIKEANIMDNTQNYFSRKSNVFNQYFVKLGWGWTLGLCAPFVAMTSLVYTGCNLRYVAKHLVRLAIATAFWFSITSIFEHIDARTGVCRLKSLPTKRECTAAKHEWTNSIDLSGHTFLLVYCVLIMLEEVKVFNQWEALSKKLKEKMSQQQQKTGLISPQGEAHKRSLHRVDYWYKSLTPLIRINFFLMAGLVLIWEIMLLSTFLYFHTIMQKLLAAFCAIIIWFVTYQTIFPNMFSMCNLSDQAWQI